MASCLTITHHDPANRPIRLTAPNGFALFASAPGDTARSGAPSNRAEGAERPGQVAGTAVRSPSAQRPCFVTAASGRVQATRGDTLVLTNLHALERDGFAKCQPAPVAYVLVSRHPDLRAESYHYNPRTWFATGIGLAALGAWIVGHTFGSYN